MKWMLVALAVVGCSRSTNGVGGNGGGDARDLGVAAPDFASDVQDLGAPADLLSNVQDLAPADLLSNVQDLAPIDLLSNVQDLAQAAADMAQTPADMAQTPADMTQTSTDVVVHVLIDNFCNSSTNPSVINAPLHVPLNLTFENDSHDYDSDIWSSRGYGYLGLVQGGVWHDPIQHCLNAVAYTEYFDVGIAGGPVGDACPNYRLEIHCN